VTLRICLIRNGNNKAHMKRNRAWTTKRTQNGSLTRSKHGPRLSTNIRYPYVANGYLSNTISNTSLSRNGDTKLSIADYSTVFIYKFIYNHVALRKNVPLTQSTLSSCIWTCYTGGDHDDLAVSRALFLQEGAHPLILSSLARSNFARWGVPREVIT
jgi:hypothetical protein